MNDNINIKWLGHSCFKLEYKGHTAVIDPYREVPGYPPLKVRAGEVFASHVQHDDHGYFDAVEITEEEGDSPFDVSVIECFHDDEHGKLRGVNNITVFSVAGKKIVHCGDLGHMITDEQLEKIRGCDVLMIPVGGFYTIEPDTAHRIMIEADPGITVPMHYRTGKYGFDEIKEPERFTELVTDRPVVMMDGPEINIPDEENVHKVIVLKFR